MDEQRAPVELEPSAESYADVRHSVDGEGACLHGCGCGAQGGRRGACGGRLCGVVAVGDDWVLMVRESFSRRKLNGCK